MEELRQRIMADGKTRAEGGVVMKWSSTRDDDVAVCIDCQFITSSDRILFIEDFLADGHASACVIDLCRQSGAQVIGMGFLVEKGFAKGGRFLCEHGIHCLALATASQPKLRNGSFTPEGSLGIPGTSGTAFRHGFP